MTRENLFIQELLVESKRDLEASNLLLKTELIEVAAWHTEQAFEKAVMYVYASYKIKFQGRPVDSVHDSMEEKLHTDKHKLMLNMLDEMHLDFGTFISVKEGLIKPSLPPDLLSDLDRFLAKSKPSQTVSKTGKQLGRVRSTLETRGNRVKSMPFDKYLDECTAHNFKQEMSRIDAQSEVKKGLKSLVADRTFEFNNKDLQEAAKVIGLDQPDLFVGIYRFPSHALIMADWVLTHPIATRYPQRLLNYDNLLQYRNRIASLREFYKEVNDEIGRLVAYGEEFLQSLLFLKDLGVQKF